MTDEVEIGPVAVGAAGWYSLTLDAAVDLLEVAVECGMTLIDTSDSAGFDPSGESPPEVSPGFGAAEERLGQVLREAPGLRERIVIATKVGLFPPVPFDSSPDYLRQAVEASRYRLGVDTIDLLQIHRPDLLTHPAELAEVLDSLRASGKVRHVGVVDHRPSQIRALQAFLEAPLATAQWPLNPVTLGPLEDGSIDVALESGLTPLASSPLGGGSLCSDQVNKRVDAVAAVADRIAVEQGVRRAGVLLAWLLHHPAGIVPVVGTTRPDRLRRCAEAEEVGLSRQQWYEILAAGRGRPLS